MQPLSSIVTQPAAWFIWREMTVHAKESLIICIFMCANPIIRICPGITLGRVLNVEIYAQRL